MKVGVTVFPGSNCDQDVLHVYKYVLGYDAVPLWHADRDLKGCEMIVIPGGFSYGDYLRTGALAQLSPVMEKVKEFAASGGPVLGICNGFQILCEAKLLPGALLENVGMRFISKFVNFRVEQTSTPFTTRYSRGDVIKAPIAHFQGNYFADSDTLQSLEENGQVIFRYCDSQGDVNPESFATNPNGSAGAIAGICNSTRNVVGLMPHPERVVEDLVGSTGVSSGLNLFRQQLELA
jgi:phosphoribosylformylglycinamidine synthase subunit PurQ / glutaminase